MLVDYFCVAAVFVSALAFALLNDPDRPRSRIVDAISWVLLCLAMSMLFCLAAKGDEPSSLEDRVTALEVEVFKIKREISSLQRTARPADAGDTNTLKIIGSPKDLTSKAVVSLVDAYRQAKWRLVLVYVDMPEPDFELYLPGMRKVFVCHGYGTSKDFRASFDAWVRLCLFEWSEFHKRPSPTDKNLVNQPHYRCDVHVRNK